MCTGLGMTKMGGGSELENSSKIRYISRIWVRIGVSRGNARLAPVFAHSVFGEATREPEAAAPFFCRFSAVFKPVGKQELPGFK